MDTALTELLRCPFCHARLTAAGEALACGGCRREFAIEDGIPMMLHQELPGAREKLAEAAGWAEKARAEGWYEPDDAVDAVLPFLNEELGWDDPNWLANGHSIRVLLGRYVREARGLRVLELGAAKAWASRFWLERDCEYVATDILADAKIGLGRGAFYGEFARVQADGEHLPFADGAFDVVYCVATLHHALDLPRMVREMARVARPGRDRRRAERGHPRPPAQPREPRPGVGEGARHQRARAHRLGLRGGLHAGRPADPADRALRRLSARPVRARALEAAEGRPLARRAGPPVGVALLGRLALRGPPMTTYAALFEYRVLRRGGTHGSPTSPLLR